MQRFLPPFMVLALAFVMTAISVVDPFGQLATVTRWFGVPVFAAGLALNLRHARLFDLVGTNIRTFDDPDQLVCSGAFTWTRNPMYLGFTIILTGFALVLGSVASFLGPAIFFVAADRWYIPFEERRLTSVFGDQYVTYQSQVRRWIGRSR